MVSSMGHSLAQTQLSPARPVGDPDLLDGFDSSLCRRFALQEGARRLAGGQALDGCFRRRQFGQDGIEAVYYPEQIRWPASYSDL